MLRSPCIIHLSHKKAKKNICLLRDIIKNQKYVFQIRNEIKKKFIAVNRDS